jgi:hypothetical protein
MDLKLLHNKETNKSQAFKLLKEYLDEQIDLARRKQVDEDNFSLPSWSEYQAFQLGVIKAYQKLYNVIPDQGASSD